jgi:hypothetical protein
MSNIRNESSFTGSFWDWGPFNKLFKYNIRISDIDGVVERNGHVLYIETKSAGVSIPEGQKRLHDAWIKKGDTVLIVWGDPNQPQRATLRHGVCNEEHDTCDMTDLDSIISRWFAWADSKRGTDE